MTEANVESSEGAIIVRVTTSDGIENQHRYSLPGSPELQTMMLKEVTLDILKSLSNEEEKEAFILLAYPMVAYKSGHVIRVAFETRGPEELQAEMQKIQETNRRIGFRTP